MSKAEWEEIIKESAEEPIIASTYRLKVPGGWIVRSSVCILATSNVAADQVMLFIADPKHEWKFD